MTEELDEKLIAAWTGASAFTRNRQLDGFLNKIQRLVAEIVSFLDAPEP